MCRKYIGEHHISICNKGENRNSHALQNDSPNSIAAFVNLSKSIFLQTEIETKSSKSENYSYRKNINKDIRSN